MAKDFEVVVVTPAKNIFSGHASEVLLPAYDGEVGILPGHGDFIGLLGTGALKIVTDGNDFWFMLSSGLYRVNDGKLVILAEVGEKPSESNLDDSEARMKELEKKLADISNFSQEEYPAWKREFDQMKARVQIHRRTELLN